MFGECQESILKVAMITFFPVIFYSLQCQIHVVWGPSAVIFRGPLLIVTVCSFAEFLKVIGLCKGWGLK
jgi:hypothetical protein